MGSPDGRWWGQEEMRKRGDGTTDTSATRVPQKVPSGARRVRDAILARFTVDTRSLALLRILLGSVLLLDLAHRSRDLARYYTEGGVFPLAAYFERSISDLSIHAISGDVWVQALLFVIAGAFALAFTLGYRTRLVGAVSLILLYSLHIRNPFVNNGGDRLLRVLLLVSLATPLGERWSIDALRRDPARSHVTTFGTAALLIQPIVVFVQNAVLKHGGDTWFAGDGLAMAIHNEPINTAIGHALADQALLLTVLNYGWVILLTGSILFLLVPIGRLRAIAALGYISAFAGMALTMAVGWFPLVLTAALAPFLTTPFWDALVDRLPSTWPVARPWTPSGTGSSEPDRPPVPRSKRARADEGSASLVASIRKGWHTTFGALVLAWILLFGTTHVTALEPPDAIDNGYLDQQVWDLFAPDPASTYAWYTVEAELANGTAPSTATLDPLHLDRAPDPPGFDTFRDRKFMHSVWSSSRDDSPLLAGTYADWVCRQAADALDRPVDRITVYRIQHGIAPGEEPPEPRRLVTIERDCTTL